MSSAQARESITKYRGWAGRAPGRCEAGHIAGAIGPASPQCLRASVRNQRIRPAGSARGVRTQIGPKPKTCSPTHPPNVQRLNTSLQFISQVLQFALKETTSSRAAVVAVLATPRTGGELSLTRLSEASVSQGLRFRTGRSEIPLSRPFENRAQDRQRIAA